MFERPHLDALYNELERDWRDNPEYERLVRDAHLGIAYSDAGRPLSAAIDTRVAELIRKHKPA